MANVQPTHPLLDYSEMIMEAIEGLNESEGSTEQSISKYIISNHADLSDAHDTLLSNTLEKLKITGQLVYVNNAYMKPKLTTDGSTKRGRGRPPKSKGLTPVKSKDLTPVRSRGRPPKPRDPLAPEAPKKAPSGRSRGRPRKYPAKPPTNPQSGEKRGRGRPPKTKA